MPASVSWTCPAADSPRDAWSRVRKSSMGLTDVAATIRAAGDQRRVLVLHAAGDRAVLVEPQPFVASEVDHVGGDGHQQRRGQAAPQRRKALVSRDLAETVQGRVERPLLRLLDRAVRRSRSRHGDARDLRAGNAVLGIVVHEEDLATARRHSKIRRSEGIGRRGSQLLEVGRKLLEVDARLVHLLGLPPHANDVKRRHCGVGQPQHAAPLRAAPGAHESYLAAPSGGYRM